MSVFRAEDPFFKGSDFLFVEELLFVRVLSSREGFIPP